MIAQAVDAWRAPPASSLVLGPVIGRFGLQVRREMFAEMLPERYSFASKSRFFDELEGTFDVSRRGKLGIPPLCRVDDLRFANRRLRKACRDDIP